MSVQDKIVRQIVEEIQIAKESETKPSNYRDSVYFQPKSGKFLYNDLYVENEIIHGMIDEDILQFMEIRIHQGEKMIRYKLNRTYYES